MSTRILLVDDHTLFREGLRALFLKHPGLEIIGEAGDATEALALATAGHPDVVVLDLQIPGVKGLEAARRLLALSPQPRVMILTGSAEMDFVPEAVRKNWRRDREDRLAGRTPEALALRREFLQKQIAVTGAMRRAGVEFLAGTDTAAPYVFPGSSLHEELELFVQAGFTPAEALASATVNPALYLGMEDKLGAVETGKLADLVLLDANPLEDIRNTRKIFAVMLNGRLLDRRQLDEIKARVAARGKQ